MLQNFAYYATIMLYKQGIIYINDLLFLKREVKSQPKTPWL